MKAIRYLSITLAIVALLAAVGWTLRNTLIQRITSPILKDYDVEVVDVSLDALGTSAASIGYLELVYDQGTTIVIEELTLPVSTNENNLRLYSAEKVSVVTISREDDAPFEMARLIDQFLSLTETLPGTEIYVEEFTLAPYPPVHDLNWTLTETDQTLSGTVESVAASLATSRLEPTTYSVSISLPGRSGTGVNRISGRLQQDDLGVSIAGDLNLDLPDWEDITKLLGIVPETLEFRSGTAGLKYEAKIPYDVAQSPSITAALTPESPMQFAYIGETGDTADVRIATDSAVDIAATFPDAEWSLRQASAYLTVTNGEWHDIPLLLNELSCQSGPTCSAQTSISWSDAEMPIGTAEKIEMSASIDLSFSDEDVRVDVMPDATLDITGFSSTGNTIGGLDARTISTATMQYSDDGWVFSADSIDANADSLSITDELSIAAPIFLENVLASESDGVMSIETGVFVPAVQANMNNLGFSLPGVSGQVSLHDDQVAFDLTTVNLHRNGTIKGRHNLDHDIGEVLLNDIAVTFAGAPLSTRVAPWGNDWDISAGNVAFNIDASWDATDPGAKNRLSASIVVEDLSGFYTDTAFKGLTTTIEFEYGGDDGFVVEPTSIGIALIEMGLPIEDLTADVALDANELAVDVKNLQLRAFNGVIGAEPFMFHTGRDINNVTVTATGLELAELLSIKEFAAVEVTGTIGAFLPITIEADGISIEAGTLIGEAPGGVIRYLAGDPNEANASAIGLVTEALSNFEYESLTSTVTYAKDGNLDLQMQLKGRNPDMDNSRPVVLNLGVENNVIQMLRSLQAARAVEEILERRLVE